MDGVGLTSLWVAAVRAIESESEGALFHDPFARALAGERGFEVLAQRLAANPGALPVLEIRTRWIDERIAEARAAGVDQTAILAAGMDSRAFRSSALAGARVYEIDRDFVLDYKREKLGDAKPIATRVEVPIDLRDDWPAALVRSGFDRTRPTLFSVEGLLPYLDAASVASLFERIDALAAKGSIVIFDVNGRSVLESQFMTPMLEFLKSIDAPWLFGTDEPESLLPSRWNVVAEVFGTIGTAYGRWPFPLAPRGMPGVPQSFLVRAAL